MGCRLILTRHAKSDWADPALDDHDRPLNTRGREAAPVMGAWLADGRIAPGLALVSTALRARQTWEGMAPRLPGLAPRFDSRIYLAAPETILEILAEAPAETILLIGHNPGIGQLAELLCDHPPDHPDFSRFPTAATLVLDFTGDPAPGAGHACAFAVPRDLA